MLKAREPFKRFETVRLFRNFRMSPGIEVQNEPRKHVAVVDELGCETTVFAGDVGAQAKVALAGPSEDSQAFAGCEDANNGVCAEQAILQVK